MANESTMTKTDMNAAKAMREFTLAAMSTLDDYQVERRAANGDRLAQVEHWRRTGHWYEPVVNGEVEWRR